MIFNEKGMFLPEFPSELDSPYKDNKESENEDVEVSEILDDEKQPIYSNDDFSKKRRRQRRRVRKRNKPRKKIDKSNRKKLISFHCKHDGDSSETRIEVSDSTAFNFGRNRRFRDPYNGLRWTSKMAGEVELDNPYVSNNSLFGSFKNLLLNRKNLNMISSSLAEPKDFESYSAGDIVKG